jgi:hypothetical protein
LVALLGIRQAFPQLAVVNMNGINAAWLVGATILLLAAFFAAALFPLFKLRKVTLTSLLRE